MISFPHSIVFECSPMGIVKSRSVYELEQHQQCVGAVLIEHQQPQFLVLLQLVHRTISKYFTVTISTLKVLIVTVIAAIFFFNLQQRAVSIRLLCTLYTLTAFTKASRPKRNGIYCYVDIRRIIL